VVNTQRPQQSVVAQQRQLMVAQRKKHLEEKKRQQLEEAQRRQALRMASAQSVDSQLAGLDLLSSTRTLPAQENLGDNAEAEEQGLAAVQREQQKEKEAAEEDLDWSDEEMEEVEYHELQGKARDIVPGSLYPTVALELNTKVPRSLRQAVLDKFLGETLRKHHFLHFALGQEVDWMQASIDEACNLEAEQYKHCQSKGVYISLCAKAMQELSTQTKQVRGRTVVAHEWEG